MTPPCCFAPTPTYRVCHLYGFPLGGRLFRLGMRSPRPTSQFHRNFPSRIPMLSMCVRGAHSLFIIYYLLSIIYYLFCPAGAISSPMLHRSATSREIATKKQPYVFRKAVLWCTMWEKTRTLLCIWAVSAFLHPNGTCLVQ